MPTEELVIGVFCMIDADLGRVKKHSQAKLYPSEVVTLMLLFAMKGGHYRAFYRWILYNYRFLFPNAPHYSRLLELNTKSLAMIVYLHYRRQRQQIQLSTSNEKN